MNLWMSVQVLDLFCTVYYVHNIKHYSVKLKCWINSLKRVHNNPVVLRQTEYGKYCKY